jgi:hypothetical protein
MKNEDLFLLNEEAGSIEFNVRKISNKFEGLDVAQILIKTQYKGEILLIGIEKDWKRFGDEVGVINLKIGDKSGLYHLAAVSHSFSLVDKDHYPQFPILFTSTMLDTLVKEAHQQERRIYEKEHNIT